MKMINDIICLFQAKYYINENNFQKDLWDF
jgi:hypothetical protein